MRRSLAVLLSLLPVLAGCKNNEGASTSAPASAQPSAAAVSSTTAAPSATAASPATAAAPTAPLVKGAAAPAFRLEGSDGKMHALADHVGKQAVVVAWFPKAFTSG